jgi:hypothetical protein
MRGVLECWDFVLAPMVAVAVAKLCLGPFRLARGVLVADRVPLVRKSSR